MEDPMGRQKIAMSPAATEAALVLGQQIHFARHDRKWTVAELAGRAGVSDRTVAAIEQGQPSISIGNVFNVAVAAGVPLFGSDNPTGLARTRLNGSEKLALLPQRIRHSGGEADVDLDF
jgi:transcriptional regulator with XRE-family HTH domain